MKPRTTTLLARKWRLERGQTKKLKFTSTLRDDYRLNGDLSLICLIDYSPDLNLQDKELKLADKKTSYALAKE